MNFSNLGFTNQLDVIDQRYVNSLSHVEFLEEAVIFLSFIVKVVDDTFIKDLFLNVHERLYIF